MGRIVTYFTVLSRSWNLTFSPVQYGTSQSQGVSGSVLGAAAPSPGCWGILAVACQGGYISLPLGRRLKHPGRSNKQPTGFQPLGFQLSVSGTPELFNPQVFHPSGFQAFSGSVSVVL